ncbi:MAG: electron transport complex subunit RsxE [Candidatus Hydrogenedentota bacterium]
MSAQPTEQTPSMDTFLKGLWRQNPVFIFLLGMCPVLAVTNTVINSLAMGIATTFVLFMSTLIISSIRKIVPKEVRIPTFIVVIATFVTMVEYAVQAISLELYDSLGAFIALIVVNCLIMGRAEAFASKNSLGRTMLDALGMGIGFTFALLCLGVVREILGSGSFVGIDLFGEHFQPWAIMILPPGAFLVLSGWLVVFAWWKERQQRRQAAVEEEVAT